MNVSELWQRFLKHAKGRRAVHNLAFELEWSGVFFGADTLQGKWEDTANQTAIIDERVGKSKPGRRRARLDDVDRQPEAATQTAS
jgi:hypothetical protein